MPLAEGEQAFFGAIIGELPRTSWTGHIMELAALLARLMAALKREQMALRAEGYIVTRPIGTDVINPRSNGVSGQFSEVLPLRRSLGIDGRSLGGEDARVTRSEDTEDGKVHASAHAAASCVIAFQGLRTRCCQIGRKSRVAATGCSRARRATQFTGLRGSFSSTAGRSAATSDSR